MDAQAGHVDMGCTHMAGHVDMWMQICEDCRFKGVHTYTHVYIYIHIYNAQSREREQLCPFVIF